MNPALVGITAIGFAFAAVLRMRYQDAGDSDRLTFANLVETVMLAFRADPESKESKNIAAFLMMIRAAEGTADSAGYRRIFAGQLFDDFSDHPRVAVRFKNRAGEWLYSTAAGAYQIVAVSKIPGGGQTRVNTWDRLKQKLNLPDFSPSSQDRAAIELIDENAALLDVMAGRVELAISKCRKTWASLPGAGYSQPERSLIWCIAKYHENGGTTA